MPLYPSRPESQRGWYVIVATNGTHAIHSIRGDREDAIASACRLLDDGERVVEVGRTGGFVDEAIDTAAIRVLYAKRRVGSEVWSPGEVVASRDPQVVEPPGQVAERDGTVTKP